MRKYLFILLALTTLLVACKKDKERISPVQSISFDSETYSMNEGEKLYLSGELTIMPTAVADTATVTWRSSDESIATVSEYGTVSGIRSGKVEICAESNGKKATCTVNVNRILVTKLMVPKKLRLPQNKWKEIPIVVEPENASLSSVRVNMYHESGVYNAMQKVEYREGSWWMYSKSGSGVVYQLDVVSDDSGDSIHAVVEVYSILATKIEFTESTYKVGIGQTYPTELIWTPDSASYKNAHYKSSDESIATVDENGVVTGVAEGMATITATSNGLETTCTAIVGNFVYKPVEKITSSLEHLWMTNDLEGITLPKGVFTVSPADASKPEVNLSVEGTASTYLQVARTADGWSLTPTKQTTDWYKGELVAKADGKEVRVPLILLNKSTILKREANAYEKYVTSYPFGYAERISLGQEIPKEFGNHMKVQLLSIENTGNQYSPQKAFDITNGTPIGTGQYITGPVSMVVAYSHVYNNTEYYRYHSNSMDYFGTTIYNWRITLDGIYGEESKVYSHDYQQVFRSGFSHYKMTISSPSKVYCVGSSQTTDVRSGGTEYVTTYSRQNYYPSSDYFVLEMPNSNPEFIGDAGPITISVQAFADHQERYGTPVMTKTYANGTAFMQEINNCISQSKEVKIWTFGTSTNTDEYHDVMLHFHIWNRYESIGLEWQGRDKFNYYFP